MTGPEIAVYIFSSSVTTLIITVGYKIHKGAKRDHEHYQHNFHNFIGIRYAQLEEEERPLVLALPEPRQEQPKRNILSRFAESYQIEKELLQEKKEAEKLRRKEEKVRYTPTEKLDPSMLLIPAETKMPLSLLEMKRSNDIEVATEYFTIVTDMLDALVEHSHKLEEEYTEAKIIRDTSRSGYPGVVSTNVLTHSQWDHTVAKDGIFWEAGLLEKNENNNTVLADDHKHLLKQWFVRIGFEFVGEKESEEIF